MSLYLRDLYYKEIVKLQREIKELEEEKERFLAINPWYPLRSINPKLGHKKRKLKLFKNKYEGTYNVCNN